MYYYISCISCTDYVSYIIDSWGRWVAQSTKHLIPVFSSGHDLGFMGWSPESASTLSGESAHDCLSLFLPLLPLICIHMCALTL